jgi:hypothetical protein
MMLQSRYVLDKIRLRSAKRRSRADRTLSGYGDKILK